MNYKSYKTTLFKQESQFSINYFKYKLSPKAKILFNKVVGKDSIIFNEYYTKLSLSAHSYISNDIFSKNQLDDMLKNYLSDKIWSLDFSKNNFVDKFKNLVSSKIKIKILNDNISLLVDYYVFGN